jgi:predicted nuclease with RNAse H fold
MIIVGFDPGGINQFGWCLTEMSKEGRLKVLDCGLESHAAGAVAATLKHIPARSEIMAVGIDSPLYWNPSGSRNADKLIRRAMRQRGASNVGGTVQEVNSLRGACLSQGIMTAHLMRQHKPNVRITESHPKALLWLLGYASSARMVRDISIADLGDLVFGIGMSMEPSDHKRDAVLGAITAHAMVTGQKGWRNLRIDERDAYEPILAVEYWMPDLSLEAT